MEEKNKKMLALSLLIAATTMALVLPFIRWGQLRNWSFDELTGLVIFPLLGLWAFSLMWAHYAIGPVKRWLPDVVNYKQWYRQTSNLVLVFILLHPILIFMEGMRNNYTSFDYVGPGRELFIYLAFFALVTFLTYEIVERMRDKVLIEKYWPLIAAFNNAAFVAIYFHGLNIGQHLQSGWLRSVWIFYGISTIFFLADYYYHQVKKKQN